MRAELERRPRAGKAYEAICGLGEEPGGNPAILKRPPHDTGHGLFFL